MKWWPWVSRKTLEFVEKRAARDVDMIASLVREVRELHAQLSEARTDTKMSRSMLEEARELVKTAPPIRIERQRLGDNELLNRLGVGETNPMIEAVLEILHRAEDEALESFARPDVPQEQRANAGIMVFAFREAQTQIVHWVREAGRRKAA